ncbi:uncharacterized protein ATNIH1004_011716 [Aspergillus tanneri]|uniref:Uncharacterized protein n=1 Tax=Aspergillus tanneri TaxID=1220188 RepID=A0A5M9M7V2_9EURO|nr:uncharacterized protein ATNIH1004_011716 [Aspergillus tanneri]KAA8641580.1 hypothetical protein ATNIH1004_011716 [Aspergillus tanneri]
MQILRVSNRRDMALHEYDPASLAEIFWQECCSELFACLMKADEDQSTNLSPVEQFENSLPNQKVVNWCGAGLDAVRPSYAGPWVEFINILYDCETRTYEWIGKIQVALPKLEHTTKENSKVLIYLSHRLLGQGIETRTCTKQDNMSSIYRWESKDTLFFWIYNVQVKMHDKRTTECRYTIRWGGLDIGSRFQIAPATMRKWSIISAPSPLPRCTTWRYKYAFLQLQNDSYDYLCQLGEHQLAHIPYLC